MRRRRSWSRKFPFDTSHVRQVPDVSGVYILLGSMGYVNYVGQSRSLQKRLLEMHHRGDVPASHFKYLLVDTQDHADRREYEVIEKYHPKYNEAS